MRIILSFLILLSAIILTAENWWMHVIKPDNYTEHWLFKAGFKDKRLIPISTFIVGVLTVLVFELLKFELHLYFAFIVWTAGWIVHDGYQILKKEIFSS